jgi:hypothetical protein
MSTNYYNRPISHVDLENPRVHIGKRAGIGKYCTGCGVSLVKPSSCIDCGGDTYPHEVMTECPACGADSDLLIRGVCKFIWTMRSYKDWIWEEYRRCRAGYEAVEIIWDEYGDGYTAEEFVNMYEEQCIQDEQIYGRWS